MSLIKNFSRNIQYQAFGILTSTIVTFFLTPFILHRIDHSLYGIYILMYSIVNYLNIMDFGISAAVIKYVAQYNAKQDWEKLQKIINLTLTLFLFIGLICGTFLFAFSFFYERVFHVTSQFITNGRYFMWITGVELVFAMFFLPIRGALNGLQRADIIKKINITSTLLKLPIAVYFFNIFPPTTAFLIYLILDGILLNILYLSSIYRLFKICPQYKFKFLYFDKSTFHKIFKFSIFVFLSGITNLVIFQTDNIVISVFSSATLVTYYSIGLALASQMRQINSILGGPIFLAVAHLAGLNDKDKNHFMLFKGTKLMNAIYAPIILITVVFCEVFILNWLGPKFSISILPARLLLVYWIFNGHLETATGFLTTKGHVDILFYANFGNALSNLVLSIILIKYLGIAGVALGTLIPMIIFCTINLIICLRKLGVPLSLFYKKALSKNIIFYFIPVLLSLLTLKYISIPNIYLTLFYMGMIFVISEVIYYAFFLDKKERLLVRKVASIQL
ncbi:oligosaccharide flippase family protein [Candidatus Margulisiibacteriota bacterium]